MPPPDQRTTIRVVIVDDDEGAHAVLAFFLARAPEIRVVGVAADGVDGLRLVRAQVPDVLLLDAGLTGRLDAPAVAAAVRATLPALAILALADHDDLRAYARLARLGVRGYGRTFAGGDVLLQTVRLLAAGYTVRAIDAERAALAERLAAISDRQQAALALVADGRTNEAIAAALHVSVKTVEGELARLMATLGAANRAQAVAKAYEYGLITPGGLAATLHPYLPDPGPDAGVSAEG